MMGTPVFDELAARPACLLTSARALDPETVIIVVCEPVTYRQLSRNWHDQDTARSLDEALHQRELERADRPLVSEVTVTAPPGGVHRQELAQLVRGVVDEFTVQPGGRGQAVSQRPPPGTAVGPARRKVLFATRRVRGYLLGSPPAGPVAVAPVEKSRVSEDDTPTELIPVIRSAVQPYAREVLVP